jgi:hypothetical protein
MKKRIEVIEIYRFENDSGRIFRVIGSSDTEAVPGKEATNENGSFAK